MMRIHILLHSWRHCFKCQQHIRQSTTDSGSILDLVFTNCATFCDVIEAYKTDHKLIYSALDIYSFPDDSLSSNQFSKVFLQKQPRQVSKLNEMFHEKRVITAYANSKG